MTAFRFSVNKRVRQLGLAGDLAWATIHGGALQLQDDQQHVVHIKPAQVSRVRIGYFDAKHRSYHTRIWRAGEQKPLELVPVKATWSGYRDTTGEFVRLLVKANGLDCIETGTSKFDALFGPALMLIPTLGALALALFVLTEEPWWGRMIIPAAPTIILGVLIWLGMKRYWPKQLRNLNDLKPHLPPA